MTSATGVSTEQSTALLHEYVYRALISKSNGTDVTAYTTFVREFSTLRKKVQREPTDNGHRMLANLVNALRDCVSVLKERAHDAIVGEVLNIKLWDAPPVVRSSVLELVSTLVVVNTAFTHTCLRLLVSTLLPPPAPPSPEANLGPWQPSEEETMVQAAVTGALTKVLDHVPTAPTSLMQLVGAHLPHKLRDRSAQCLYFSALFRLAESRSGGPVRDAVLAMTVEHLLSLDVDIRWEDIVDANTAEAQEEVEGEVEEDIEDIFQLEGMTELDLNATPEELERMKQERLAQQAASGPRGGWEGATAAAAQDPAAAAGPSAATSATTNVDETANKLDSLMELTFSHLDKRCQHDLEATWGVLLACFERTILNTHRSKFSQFLVFFVCHKHPEPCVRSFVELLLTRLHDTRLPHITRSACAAYLASFSARCSAVSPALVLHALEALTQFVEQYLASADLSSSQSSLYGSGQQAGFGATAGGGASGGLTAADSGCLTTKHQVLYAAVQAILYVVCYHLDSLLHHQHQHHHKRTIGEATRALLTTRVLRCLAHPLQPLSVCLPSVVTEFRSQLAHHGIADIPAPATDTTRTAQRPLEMFFPFDPYLLKRSAGLLELPRSYVTWRRGRARGAGRAVGATSHSDDEEDEEEGSEVALQRVKEEDDDLDLQSSESSDESSSDAEDGSLRGRSLTSDHMGSQPHAGMLNKLKPPTVPFKRTPASNGRAAGVGATAHAWGHGSGSTHSKHTAMATSFEPVAMATSYGVAMGSSMGDVTPTGTSPVVVEYYHGPVMGQSVSPMQMTPQFHTHMDAVPSRLAAGRLQ